MSKTATMQGKRIGVIMGGLSSEREVSLRTGQGILAALLGCGYDAVGIDWCEVQGLPRQLFEARIEVAFIALHGVWGEDGCVQGLLECLQIPYTGSGVLGSALAMDKVMTKRVFDRAGVATANWRIYRGPEDSEAIGYPLVIKPSREGSSVGVAIVRDPKDLAAALVEAKRWHGEVIVEEYVKGREIQVGILDGEVLGDVEVRPGVEFYSYEAKYQRSDTTYLCPAPLDEAEHVRLGAMARLAHEALACAGYSRVDLILGEGGRAVCLEVNTLPGMTEKSLLPKIASARGMDYATLVERILASASLKA